MNRFGRRDRRPSRKLLVLIVVVISLFCIIFFAARGRFTAPVANQVVSTVLSPFQGAVSWLGEKLYNATSVVWDIATVHKQNEMLRNEVEQLRIQNLEASEALAENARLRDMIGYKQMATQFDLLAARVIGREADSWTNTIVINRGQKDGVEVGMAVVTPQGLVGHISEADWNTSKVQLITDPRSSVGTIVQRAESRVAGIVEGSTSHPNMPQMINIPRNADVQEGDIVVTSGFGGIYPKGIVVGTINSLENDTAGLLKIGIMDTAVDLQKLEDVMVITASREAPPEPLKTPTQTPGTETDPAAQKAEQDAAAAAANGDASAQPQDQSQAQSSDGTAAAGGAQ